MISPPSKVSPGEKVTAAHHNALLDYVLRTTPRAGRNTTISEKPNGCFINAQPGGGAAATAEDGPFRVRWHAPDGDGQSAPEPQWEIYLPTGCMSVEGSCTVLNTPASETSGHEDEDGWYVLPFPQGDDPGEYRVVVHGKQRTQLQSEEDNSNDIVRTSTRPAMLAAAEKAEWVGEEESETRQDYAGDVIHPIVATITLSSEEGGGLVRQAARVVSAPIVVQGERAATFDLVWIYSRAEGAVRPALEGILCANQSFSAGGTSYEATSDGEYDPDEPLAAGNQDAYIWLKIDTSAALYKITVEENTTSSILSTDEVTWVRLYTLRWDRVDPDERTNLNQVPIYRAYASP